MAESTNDIISRLMNRNVKNRSIQDEEEQIQKSSPVKTTPISFETPIRSPERLGQESTSVTEKPVLRKPGTDISKSSFENFENPIQTAQRIGPATSEQTKKAMGLIFPTASKAPTLGRKIAGGVSDVLTFPARSFYGGKRSIEAEPGKEAEAFEKGMTEKGEGFVEKTLKDPRTTAAVGAAAATGGMSFLPTIATEAAAVMGAGQAKSFAEEGKADPVEAGIDGLLTSIAPGIGKALSVTGRKIFTSALKASKNALKGVKAGKYPAGTRAQLTEKAFEKNMAGSFNKFSQKVDDKLSTLDADLDKKTAESLKEINAKNILDNAEKSIDNILKKGEGPSALFQDAKAVKRQVAFEKRNLEEISESGMLTPQQFRKWKTSLGKKGKFNVNDNQTMTSKKSASNQIFEAARKYQVDNVPGAKALNKEMSELIPVSIALKDAAIRTSGNYPIGLREVIAAVPAVAGHVGSSLGFVSAVRATSSATTGAAAGKLGDVILKTQKGIPGVLQRRGISSTLKGE
jgi:hypothetical protein